MNIIKAITESAKKFWNAITQPVSYKDLFYLDSYGGETITPNNAMRQATVYSCVNLIADNVAQLPLHLYKRTKNGRVRAEEHSLYNILKNQPNSWQTPFEFFQFMTMSLLLRGIACAYIGKIGNRIASLIPIAPDSVQEVWDYNGDHYFDVSVLGGNVQRCKPDEIFCVKAFTLDGRYSESPIRHAARTIGVSLAAEKHNDKMLTNGARPSGILTTPNNLSKETVQSMSEEWNKNYGGDNTGKVAVLWGGIDFKPITMSNADTQLLQILDFQRTEIAGVFRVPPHMVGAIDKSSSWGSGITEQKQSFITFTLAPWLVRFQQAVSRDLLDAAERRKYYAEFVTEQFLMANTKERADAYKIALGSSQGPGWMTVNEVRQKENLPEIPGEDSIYKPVSQTQTENLSDDRQEQN